MGECAKNQMVLRDGTAFSIQKKLDEWAASRIFLVTGRDSYIKSGAKAFVDQVLNDRAAVRFQLSAANPAVPDLLSGGRQVRNFKPNCFIAVGGGAVMDMAKLLNFFSQDDSCLQVFLDTEELPDSAYADPLIAIPTTAGSGSEATGFAVLYDGDRKLSVESPCMLPDLAVLNSEFTESLSSYQTACSGFDAFAQAIESFWAVGATETSRQFSSKAITLCLEHLEAAVTNPSLKHRRAMMEAAHFAGKAIGMAKTTAAHALSYFLTSHYGLPHGHAVATLLPVVFKVNSDMLQSLNDAFEWRVSVIKDLCKLLGCVSPDVAVEKIECLAFRIGLTRDWIKKHRIDSEEMCRLMVQNVNRDRLSNNPIFLDDKALFRVVSTLRM